MERLRAKRMFDELLPLLGISKAELSRKAKLKEGAVGGMAKRNSVVPLPVLLAICAAYPQVNHLWMLFGAGSPLLDEGTEPALDEVRADEVRNAVRQHCLVPAPEKLSAAARQVHGIYHELLLQGKVKHKEDFSVQLGYENEKTASNILRGDARVTSEFATRLQETFGVSCDWDQSLKGKVAAPPANRKPEVDGVKVASRSRRQAIAKRRSVAVSNGLGEFFDQKTKPPVTSCRRERVVASLSAVEWKRVKQIQETYGQPKKFCSLAKISRGTLKSLAASGSALTITLTKVRQAFETIDGPSEWTAPKIVELAAKAWGVEVDQIGSSRKGQPQEVVHARQAAAYLLDRDTKLSLKEIAQQIGYKDHTGVIVALKTINDRMDTDRKLWRLMLELRNTIQNS